MSRKVHFGALVLATALLAGPAASSSIAQPHNVTLQGLTFAPADLTIPVGDTVHWVWVSGFHNVESGGGGIHDGIFRSGNPTSSAGTTFDVVFDQAFLDANPKPGNVYPYYCAVHVGSGMTGSVTVEAPASCDTCTGDVNDDNQVDGLDIQGFVSCFITGDPTTPDCVCADMDASGTFDDQDVTLFVDRLLNSPPPC